MYNLQNISKPTTRPKGCFELLKINFCEVACLKRLYHIAGYRSSCLAHRFVSYCSLRFQSTPTEFADKQTPPLSFQTDL